LLRTVPSPFCVARSGSGDFVPVEGAEFVAALPKTASGKVTRRELREREQGATAT
jgi:acyl-coenzyme A synthetase/AMP-(fatty) acid ligase